MLKKSKKIIALVIVLVMVVSYFIPISNVIASVYGDGTNFIKMDIVNNNTGFILNSATVNDYSWTDNNDEFHSTNDVYTIVINVQKDGDRIPDILYGGNWSGLISKTWTTSGNNYIYTLNVNNSIHNTFLGLEIVLKNGEQQSGPEPHFDGKAYVLWSCGSGTCYHYFENIPSFDDGNSTFYKDIDIKADNDQSIHFDVHAEYKAWALPDKFNNWKNAYMEHNDLESINWSQVDPEDIIAEFPPDMRQWEEMAVAEHENDSEKGCARPAENAPGDKWGEFQSCVDEYYISAGNLPFIRLQPVGEPSANNAYVSYGDRNFKVVIYNSDYKGVTLGDLSDLNYYPAHWTNAFLRTDQYDISGTTKNKPALLDSILLENTVHFMPISLPGNTLVIDSIEPLDVPEDAIEVSYINNQWTIVFASNFYDNVIFKVTDTSNHEYYIKIKRYTVDAYLNFVGETPEEHHPAITAEFYFERSKSYTDFELTAKIIYKNGTIKTVPLTAIPKVDDGLGNMVLEYEADQQNPGKDQFGNDLPTGKGLKKSVFRYDLESGEENTIEKAYINVEKTGSTAENYAGAYTGSGEGVKVYMGEDE